MARATELRDVIKARLYPFAESRGFARAPSGALATTFRRATADVTHVFEVDWDKFGAPSFSLSFGECPPTGVEMLDLGHVDAAEVRPSYCARFGLLRRRKGPFGTFKLQKPWLEAIRSLERCYKPDEVAEQAIDLFPEIEAWWSHKQEGPHLHFIR